MKPTDESAISEALNVSTANMNTNNMNIKYNVHVHATKPFHVKSKSSKSLISGFSQISSFAANSEFRANKTYYMSRALVIIAGIGEYDSDVEQPLIGVNQDYINIIYAFYHRLGYSILYKNKSNEIIYVNADDSHNHDTDCKSNEKFHNIKDAVSLHKSKENAKLRWTGDELEDFFKKGKDYVEENKHDSCILVISSHGKAEGVIIDSKGEDVSLEWLFDPFMGQSCKYLVDKPKIAIVDSCRGMMRQKPIASKTYGENNEEGKSKNQTNKQTVLTEELKNNDDTMVTTKKKDKEGEINETKESEGNNSNTLNVTNNVDHKPKLVDVVDTKNKLYHPRSNLMIIYANPDGYAALDGGSKGGYLIRAVKNVFSSEEISLNQTLDDMVVKIRNQAREAAGTAVAQMVERLSTMTYHVRFFKGIAKKDHESLYT